MIQILPEKPARRGRPNALHGWSTGFKEGAGRVGALSKIQAVCTQSREGERGRGGRLQRRRRRGRGVGQIEKCRAVSVGEGYNRK